MIRSTSEKLGLKFDDKGCAKRVSRALLLEVLVNLVVEAADPVAVIADFASRLIQQTRRSNRGRAPAALLKRLYFPIASIRKPNPETGEPFFNPVIWIVEKEGDLPDWFTDRSIRASDIHSEPVGRASRRSLIAHRARWLGARLAAQAETADRHSASSTNRRASSPRSRRDRPARAAAEKMHSTRYRMPCVATRSASPKIPGEDRPRKISARGVRERRVKGQDHAVTHMLDIVKRAVTGVGRAPRGGGPRGVPSSPARPASARPSSPRRSPSSLFGDESAYIRFDMSEFSAEHADQRLIGAPPGYVGYDAGGELTNAIREKPFSVVLFDEIEKAHPRILDKFLQVLDDGVLTSGRGDRVYFSEAFIVFTSNLGIYRTGPTASAAPTSSQSDAFEDGASEGARRDRAALQVRARPPRDPQPHRREHHRLRFHPPDVAEEIFDQIVRRTLD